MTIATGFVVDDAIVVIENITRHLEEGCAAGSSAARGRGNRLYRGVDQHLAGGGVYSDSADERAGGQAVPRICRDAVGRDRHFAGDFADDHADDVRGILRHRNDGESPAGFVVRASGLISESLGFMSRTLGLCCAIRL